MNLQIESGINPTELQKAPAQGAARKAGFREFREEAASSNEDVAGAATNHRDFINAVFRPHHQLFHILDRLQLDAFRPTVRGPCVQQRPGGAADGLIHVGFFIHQLTITVQAGTCQTLSTMTIVISSVCDRPMVKLWIPSSNFRSKFVEPAGASARIMALTRSSPSISP